MTKSNCLSIGVGKVHVSNLGAGRPEGLGKISLLDIHVEEVGEENGMIQTILCQVFGGGSELIELVGFVAIERLVDEDGPGGGPFIGRPEGLGEPLQGLSRRPPSPPAPWTRGLRVLPIVRRSRLERTKARASLACRGPSVRKAHVAPCPPRFRLRRQPLCAEAMDFTSSSPIKSGREGKVRRRQSPVRASAKPSAAGGKGPGLASGTWARVIADFNAARKAGC